MPRRLTDRSSTILLLVLGIVSAFAVGIAVGQQPDWAPSPWGPDDQRGAANRLTPAKVLEARDLIETGEVFALGRLYEAGMPVFPGRHYSLRIPYPLGPFGENVTTGYESIISGELGQVGTQFDGLGHAGIGDRYYNGLTVDEFVTREGLTKLGVEQVGPMVTRGVLIDVPSYKGVDMLEGGYEITPDDLRGALARQRVSVSPGDVVLIHTGWGALWMKDNERFIASEPGIGLAAARYLIDAEIVMVGSDNLSTEVVPNPDPSLVYAVHQELLTKNGIYNMENLATEILAENQVYEFAFVYAPLPLKGSPGSPGNPVAIR